MDVHNVLIQLVYCKYTCFLFDRRHEKCDILKKQEQRDKEHRSILYLEQDL